MVSTGATLVACFLAHMLDFLEHLFSGKNIGLLGTSPHVAHYWPLRVRPRKSSAKRELDVCNKKNPDVVVSDL